MSKLEASQLVAILFASYPSAHLERTHVDAYVSGILDLSAKDAHDAVTRLRRTSKFLPSIAEIREACVAQTLGPMRLGGEAWQDAMSEVRRTGRYAVPRFADPLVAETIRMWGSWVGFCDSPEDDPGGRARFIELYEQLAARRRADIASGIALPAPRSGPQPKLASPPPAPAPPAPPMPVLTLPSPKPRPVSACAGRKMTAEEIDAALGGASDERKAAR